MLLRRRDPGFQFWKWGLNEKGSETRLLTSFAAYALSLQIVEEVLSHFLMLANGVLLGQMYGLLQLLVRAFGGLD